MSDGLLILIAVYWKSGSKMPYVLVRESFINTFCCVEGLPLNEGKILGRLVCYLVYTHNDRSSISLFVLAYFMFLHQE